MEKYINEFLDYILKQKKYSSNTAKNYSIDIDEFKTYLKKEILLQENYHHLEAFISICLT